MEREASRSTLHASRPTQYCELTEAEAYTKARADWGDAVVLVQDTDVLDTWFSSGLWPFSTLGWPKETSDMAQYYPTTMLETGYDIIFFWVARMVMMGLELTGEVPFKIIYLHGLIRENDGKKMSKSRPEKAVDPLDMIDAYGCDALRFYLITAGAPGNDIKVEVKTVDGKKQVERIEGARNFANKLWNAARFVITKVSAQSGSSSTPVEFSMADRWIQVGLGRTTAFVLANMNTYRYGNAGDELYEFIWNDFCDWYLEFSKIHQNSSVLVETLDAMLRLLHPFMPFITEEIWQKLKEAVASNYPLDSFNYPALMLVPYQSIFQKDPTANQSDLLEQTLIPLPQESPEDLLAHNQMGKIQEVVTAIRKVRADYKVAPEKRVAATIIAGEHAALLESQRAAIVALAKVDDGALTIAAAAPAPDKAVAQMLGDITVYLPMAGLVDLDAEKKRLSDELAALEQAIIKSDNLLNSDFGKRAPANVIEKEKAKLADAHQKSAQLKERLASL